MTNAKLAYPMQLGSGTTDLILGGTYLGQADLLSWGFQSLYCIRIGENSEKYTLGNKLSVTGWGAIKASDYLSFSLSLSYLNIEKITGSDPELNPMMMPLFNAANFGRTLVDAGLGANVYFPEGGFKNLRLGIEVRFPVLQDVNGIQMENGFTLTSGLQYSFGGH